ncbi:hypothetical protein GTA08_BOTSDO13413 [Botryosphaeria dothidea]|uniref:Uncharacterized protein n=1 Tax=Botryosphaeria dothidea TaxID=55169 RepID=A0A8H4J1I4_9PEZI|nr:hypothetical protein GTA08_BOTSDO13413 [Botryosphaeria dothidea]
MHSTLHVALRLVLVSSLTAYILLRLLSVIDWTILRFFLATLFTTLVNAFAKFSFLRLPPVRNWKKQTQELTIIEISLENRRAGHRNLGRGEDADLGKAEHAAKYLSYGPKHKKLLLKRARHESVESTGGSKAIRDDPGQPSNELKALPHSDPSVEEINAFSGEKESYQNADEEPDKGHAVEEVPFTDTKQVSMEHRLSAHILVKLELA